MLTLEYQSTLSIASYLWALPSVYNHGSNLSKELIGLYIKAACACKYLTSMADPAPGVYVSSCAGAVPRAPCERPPLSSN